ncbi:MAG: T9SS type A sorting domain-containing protein [Bacteroidota bacterium]
MNANVRIIDIKGRVVFSQAYEHNEAQIKVDALDAGLYVVHLFTREGMISRKLMVK